MANTWWRGGLEDANTYNPSRNARRNIHQNKEQIIKQHIQKGTIDQQRVVVDMTTVGFAYVNMSESAFSQATLAKLLVTLT